MIRQKNATNNRQQSIRISIGRQDDGCAFRLDEEFRSQVEPSARRLGTIFVGMERLGDFVGAHGPVWLQVAELLTGFTASKLRQRGCVFVNGATGEVVHQIKRSSPQ
jgi:hypothetical protein